MGPRKFQFALAEIHGEIEWIEQITAGRSLAAFEADRTLRYAVERSLEIISEASRRIPEDWKATQPEIDWRAIAGIGNILRHAYHAVAPAIVWNAIEADLPALKAAVAALAAAAPDETE